MIIGRVVLKQCLFHLPIWTGVVAQCLFEVVPALHTVSQHYTSIGCSSRVGVLSLERARIGVMLGHSLRRCPIIEPASGRYIVCARAFQSHIASRFTAHC